MRPTISVLPHELVRHIIFHLRDNKPDVLSCLLVSRSWFDAALPNLYYRYTLGGYDLSLLERLLRRDYRIGYWTRILCVSGFCLGYQRLILSTTDPSSSQHSLGFKNLHTIQFYSCQIFSTTDREYAYFQSLLQALSDLPLVRTVEFIKCSMPQSVMIRIMDAFPSTTKVLAYDCYFINSSASLEVSMPDRSTNITSAHVFSEHYSESPFVGILSPLIGFSTRGLRTLQLDFDHISWYVWDDLRLAWNSFGPTLEELTLRLPVQVTGSDGKRRVRK